MIEDENRKENIMAQLLLPKDLKTIAMDAEMAKVDEERAAKKRKEQEQAALREAFLSRELHPEVVERVNRAIRIAAEQGHHQVQVMTFSSTYTSDRGRMINVADPEWPKSLDGFAKKAYEFFDKELRPLGYKLHAEIISFPDGMPGDVAMYLKW